MRLRRGWLGALLRLVLLLCPLLRLQVLGLLPGPLLLFLLRPLLRLQLLGLLPGPLLLFLLRPLLRLQLLRLLPGSLLLFLLRPLLRLVLLQRPLLGLELFGLLPGALLLFLLGPLLRLVQRARDLLLRSWMGRRRRRCAGRLRVLDWRRPSAGFRNRAAALWPWRAIAAVERHKDAVTRRRGKGGGPRQQQAQCSGLEDLPSHGAPLALKSAGSPGAGAATQPLDREHRMAIRWTTRERASGPAA